MKIKSKQVFAGVAAVGLLAVLLFYVYFFLEYQDKTDSLKSEITALESRLAELRAYEVRAEEFQTEIDAMNIGMEQIMNKYPANAKEEDAIMLAVELEQAENVYIGSINISGEEQLATVPVGTLQAAGRESETDYTLVERKITYNNDVDYLSLKNCIEKIYKNPNRVAINAITYKRSGEGMLQGNIDVSFYSLQGTGKEYVKPNIASYVAGKANLFQ